MTVRDLKDLLRDVPDHFAVCIETIDDDNWNHKPLRTPSPLAGKADDRWEFRFVLVAEKSEASKKLF